MRLKIDFKQYFYSASWILSVPLTIHYWVKTRDGIIGWYYVIGEIIFEILGIEEASFWDQNQDAFGNVWERYFWTKNPTWMMVFNLTCFWKKIILGTSRNVNFGQKKQNTFWKWIFICFFVPKWRKLKSQNQNFKIFAGFFCPETLAQFPDIGFFVQNSRIGVKGRSYSYKCSFPDIGTDQLIFRVNSDNFQGSWKFSEFSLLISYEKFPLSNGVIIFGSWSRQLKDPIPPANEYKWNKIETSL